jgi:UDP-N-acetylmuramoyl-tripeptide--D-alanyl-D-alanine ligase
LTGAAPLWTHDSARDATGGHCRGRWRATGVAIDSRVLKPGDLFIALQGPSFDGHDFVADALARGAAAAVMHRLPQGIAADAPLLVVGDTMTALHDLGRAGRARAAARVIGVTGSVGKTGVKEALRLVLGREAPTSANDGSLNNHWGLPLSLARLPADARYGVFEMGMNHAGELSELARLARPHVAVITTVAAVHSAHFASEEAIADAKAEIFAGLAPGGCAVLHRDNRHFARLAAAAAGTGVARILSFGADPAADVRLIAASADADGSDVRANIAGKPVAYRVGLPGQHWVTNSLCVLATVVAAGADPLAAAAALADLAAPKGRGQRFVIRLTHGRFTLIDDSYNASPVSIAAALQVLGSMAPGEGGRRIAVLGDMLELGEAEAALHAGLAQPIEVHGIDQVWCAGARMHALYQALSLARRGGYAADSARLAPMVAAAVAPGDVVTVKGSAGSKMGRVVDALKALDAAAPAREAAMAGGA